MKIQNIPYYAIAGLLLIVSMLLYTLSNAGFWTFIFPTYLTEALLFAALGFAFWTSFKKSGFTVFLMSLVWLLNQIFNWTGLSSIGSALTFAAWLLLLVQIGLTGFFFMDKPIKFFDFQSNAWPYASAFILLIYGFAKMYLDYVLVLPVMWLIWGMAITLITFGYVIRTKSADGSAALQIFGLLLAVVSAFAVQGSGLTLL
jgi:hypothetical protein